MARKRKLWSRQQEAILSDAAKLNIRARAIAWRLRRTENAVRQKAFSLGLSLETRPGKLAA